MGHHDVSQICLNGHTISRSIRQSPEFARPFCTKCGEPTITNCAECNQPIPGEYHVEGIVAVGFSDPPPPSFCHACGRPYPWTQRGIASAIALAQEMEGLSESDREVLKQSLDDIQREGPGTELAAVRFKKIMAKVGMESYSSMKNIVVNVVSEAVRKTLFGA